MTHERVKRVGTDHGAERERVEPIEFEYTKTRKKEKRFGLSVMPYSHLVVQSEPATTSAPTQPHQYS